MEIKSRGLTIEREGWLGLTEMKFDLTEDQLLSLTLPNLEGRETKKDEGCRNWRGPEVESPLQTRVEKTRRLDRTQD